MKHLSTGPKPGPDPATGGVPTSDPGSGGFTIYIHWPFCQSKCPYCDFNSHVATSIDQEEWTNAYLAELDRGVSETGDRTLNSVFFGGGTPSLMEVKTVDRILDHIFRNWRLTNDVEVTLEANPGSIEATRFTGYRTAGVNRISMGMQAMDDTDLRRLGRLHTADEAFRAFSVARERFDRVSFDLIYGRQDQTLRAWEDELRQALSMAVDHLSLYQLTIEDGTVFGERQARGQLRGLPDEDLSADMYELTQDVMNAAGLPAYEISNHARPGSESRHNLVYWRSGDYLGIGPGAHGRLTREGIRQATTCPTTPSTWLASVRDNGHGELPRTTLSAKDHAREFLIMGLRLTEGVDLNRYAALSGTRPAPDQLAHLSDLGLIETAGPRLWVTRRGRMLLNQIIRHLAED